MTDRGRKNSVLLGLSAVCLLTAGVLYYRFTQSSAQRGPRVFYYDLSARALFDGPPAIPPVVGIDSDEADGVRAIVVACPGGCGDPQQQRIAYLERYTDELKALFAAAQRGEVEPPARGSPFVLSNMLVRRADEDQWHPHSSLEAERIVTEWQQRCADGSYPQICSP